VGVTVHPRALGWASASTGPRGARQVAGAGPVWSAGGSGLGQAKPVDGLQQESIELHRRIARGFRSRHNYRLRMLPVGGGLTHPT
jgi:hypothetical protein